MPFTRGNKISTSAIRKEEPFLSTQNLFGIVFYQLVFTLKIFEHKDTFLCHDTSSTLRYEHFHNFHTLHSV